MVYYRNLLVSDVKSNLGEIYGIGSDYASKIFSNFEVSFVENPEEVRTQLIEADIEREERIEGVVVRISKNPGDSTVSLRVMSESVSNRSVKGLKMFLGSVVYYALAIYPISRIEVFPVERNSIYTFSKELSIRKQDAIDKIQRLVNDKDVSIFDLFQVNSRYSKPIKDSLTVAEDLAEVKKQRSAYYDFAEELEQELLHGKVKISSDGDIQFSPKQSGKVVLPIQMTASIVKTLSSLVVYLKHRARKNDLIIIDEPEINLHPSNQIVLTRLMARLANQGFRLLVSTHSDYIVREFNNLIMLGNRALPAITELRQEYGIGEDEYLDKEEVGVYVFKPKRKGNLSKIVTESVAVDHVGFTIESMDKVIERQNEMSEDLYYSIEK